MTRSLVEFAIPMIGVEEQFWVRDVFSGVNREEGRRITNAGRVMAFEEQFSGFIGGGMSVAVSSCMAGLHLCLMKMGVGPGKRVVVPALTHPAVANATELLGADCVFVDCHPESGNLDPDLIPDGIDLITVVHFLGRPGYMKSLQAVARKQGVEILEDCALALGSIHDGSGKHVGLIGKAGCFSFYPAKHMTTAEGGMIVTTDPEFADQMRLLRSFGYGPNRDAGIEYPGLNYRMTEFQAALGLAQIPKQRKFLKIRQTNRDVLAKALEEFHPIGGTYALCVTVPPDLNRDEVKARLLSARIETSVYYPRPVCDHPYYQRKYGNVSCPNARHFSERTIALSVGPHLNERHMRYQAEKFKEIIVKLRNRNASSKPISRESVSTRVA